MKQSKLQELLKKIEAKLELGMKLTDYEWSLYILYRDKREVEKNAIEQLCG